MTASEPGLHIGNMHMTDETDKWAVIVKDSQGTFVLKTCFLKKA
jgi:hypothetical protein